MSAKELPNGRWQIRWRDPAGKQRSKNFRRKIDAERFERNLRTDLERGSYIAPSAGKITVSEFADQWLERARNLGDGGRETYRRDLDRHILPVLGDIPLGRLTDDDIDDYLTARLAAGAAASSVHREYRTINRLLNVALHRRKLQANPAAVVEPPKLDKREMRFLEVTEVERVAEEIAERYACLVLLMAWTGLRWSEASGLQTKRLDGESVTVADQLVLRGDGLQRAEPKSDAARRTVPMPPFLVDLLDDHLTTYAEANPDGLVFPTRTGKPLTGPSFRGNHWVLACGRAGLATQILGPDGKPLGRLKWTGGPRIHDLRHTYAALLVAAGAHPKAMQLLMGHSTIQTTLGDYGHMFPDLHDSIGMSLHQLHATKLDEDTQPSTSTDTGGSEPASEAP